MIERLLVITPQRHNAQLVHARVAGRWPGAEVVLRDPSSEPVPESGINLAGYSAVMVDQELGVPGQTGLGWIKRLRAGGNAPPIFVVTDVGDLRTAVRAIKRGADDYLTYNDLSPDRIGRTLVEVLEGTLEPTLAGTEDDNDQSLVEATIDATQVISRGDLDEMRLSVPDESGDASVDVSSAMARMAEQERSSEASSTVDKTQRLSVAELQAARDRGASGGRPAAGAPPAARRSTDAPRAAGLASLDALPDIVAEQAAASPAPAAQAAATSANTLPEIGFESGPLGEPAGRQVIDAPSDTVADDAASPQHATTQPLNATVPQNDIAATVALNEMDGIHSTQALPNHAAAVASQHAARTQDGDTVARAPRNEVDLIPAQVGDVGVLHLPGREPLAVPGYRIRHMLGSGATSKVFKADRLRDNRPVVFKVLDVSDDEDPAVLRRFMREYKILREIRHPNILRIYTRVLAPDYMCLVMEYCDGGDLSGQLASGLGPAKALRYLRDIACGLAAGHGRGIVHRDIKPGNVLFRSDGTLALGDFGAASQFGQERVTAEGTVVGTPYYVSPEVLRQQEATARSDIYSLGVLFYEMLTGERPYIAKTLTELVDMHLNAPVPKLPSLVGRMQPLLDKLMAKDPADRPASALALFNAIRARVD